MPWQYQIFADNNIANVLPQVHNCIKGLNNSERMSAKAETTDAKDDLACGVVFYNPDVEYDAPPEMPRGTWSIESYSNVDLNAVLPKVAEKLNLLSKAQAFYAKVVASDAKYQPYTAAVLWPEPL